MHFLNRKNGRIALAAFAAGALAVTSACSGDGDGGDDATGEDGKITLTVSTFNTFGYVQAGFEKMYEDANPNIDVVFEGDGVGFDDVYRPALETALDAGSGFGDVVAMDEQATPQLFQNGDLWYDLSAYEARSADYTENTWNLGHTPDDKLVGLGTDIGGLAMCYRSDLFEAAGLPTERDAVAAAWSDWDGFKALAQQYVDADTGTAFIDNGTQLQNVMLSQFAGLGDGAMYVDNDGNLTLDSAAATQSLDLVLELNEMGAVGNFPTWGEEWNAAMADGGFAVMPCPGWMASAIIEPTSGPDNAGKWDMAAAPGVAGNWGGSFLAVPAAGPHPEEAAALADWLTQPEQQILVYEAVGNFPSSPTAQADPRVADKTSPYFSDAPVGAILSASIQSFPALEYSYYHPPVKGAVESTINGIVDGSIAPADARDAIASAAEEAIQLAGAGM
ncbi:extracellular solute-binding protein [Glycomyces algeriensis]|uniref:Sugar ABC transporter substrate-binding protein n=1 Tax=Glycomyces algeriensis TaxID=256037 RepID=A0A9W6G6X5_9ACTN|nr:extracellular solute-binding protein [Glycomyces algeriensis]MDA1366353.1 extracellular solute-binding protein [Glycomyces algeriensis]MDR7348701.1 cellobiose transport system substrate-binding protein [Glycomyces algeriensis]GLI41403.1 sugar ABC transporter substrate-binding protein [Glycomyces algeriensis]